MDRIQFIDYQGVRILSEDFSNTVPGEEFMQTLDIAHLVLHAEPANSVLVLFDATGARYNNDTLNIVKNATAANTRYVRAAAVFGLTGLARVAIASLAKEVDRNLQIFETREEALTWLLTQQ